MKGSEPMVRTRAVALTPTTPTRQYVTNRDRPLWFHDQHRGQHRSWGVRPKGRADLPPLLLHLGGKAATPAKRLIACKLQCYPLGVRYTMNSSQD